MKRKIEITAKKVEDAIEEGLRTLNTTIDEVDVKIISTGGFLRKAKIEMYYGEDLPEEKVVEQPEAKPTLKSAVKPAEKAAAKPIEKQSEKAAAKPVEKPAEKAAVKPADKVALKPADNNAATQAPVEPHWGSAPIFKKEPSMASVNRPPQRQNNHSEQNNNRGEQNNNRGEQNNNRGEQNNNRGEQNNNRGEQSENSEERGSKNRERESEKPTEIQRDGAVAYLSDLLKHMGIEGVASAITDDGLRLKLETEDSRVIGYRGEVLDSIQYLVSLKVNELGGKYVHVSLDALNYRGKRKGVLESMAKRMAEKAISTGKKVSLEPMNSSDRRIIHAVLSENLQVSTKSEGHEPARRIIILPKNKTAKN